MDLRQLAEALASGTLSVEQAEEFLSSYGVLEVGYHRLDPHREKRSGTPECIFGLGKSAEQLLELLEHFVREQRPVLVTKVSEEKSRILLERFPSLEWDPVSRLLRCGSAPEEMTVRGSVGILTAGSSDLPIAEETAQTLSWLGVEVTRAYDCGVAGLHRLFQSARHFRDADLLIVIAGMDGALPSVVGGAFRAPVIAVPTSIGYGASFDGLAALLTMLNSCAPGVTVVNIDNGFGAAVAARSILAMAGRLRCAN